MRRIGWLTRARGEQIRECLVWDESDTGMRLVVDAPDDIPDTFYVYPTLDSSSRRHCRVIWRADRQIGIEFLRSNDISSNSKSSSAPCFIRFSGF